MELQDTPVDVIFQQVGRMQRTLSVRSWPFWKLPRALAAFVAAVILADLAVFAAAAAADGPPASSAAPPSPDLAL